MPSACPRSAYQGSALAGQVQIDSATPPTIAELRQRYEKRCRLAIVGEFNAGKSALVNVLLGHRVSRRGAIPTTGAVTELRWARRRSGQVFSSDGELIVRNKTFLIRAIMLGMGRVAKSWVRRAFEYTGINSMVRGLDLDFSAVVAGVVGGALVSVPGDAVTGVGAGLFVAVLFRRVRRHLQPWRRAAGATLLDLLLRLPLGQLADVKVEEWCAELAGIKSRWERMIYLVDLIGHLPQQARAVRESRRKESA